MSTKLEKLRDKLAKKWSNDIGMTDEYRPWAVEDFKTGFNAADEHYRPLIEELMVVLGIADEALLWSEQMFVARDEMNAKVHCAPVRLSPITERVKLARQALESVRSKI